MKQAMIEPATAHTPCTNFYVIQVVFINILLIRLVSNNCILCMFRVWRLRSYLNDRRQFRQNPDKRP